MKGKAAPTPRGITAPITHAILGVILTGFDLDFPKSTGQNSQE